MCLTFYKIWVKNLELIDNTFIYIQKLEIPLDMVEKLYESHWDNLWRLKVDELYLKWSITGITSKIIKALTEIKMKALSIDYFQKSFDNLKICLSLGIADISSKFEFWWDEMLWLTFLNSQILLLDDNSDQKVYIELESLTLELKESGYKDIILLKANWGKNADSDMLFIPLESVLSLRLSKIKTTSNLYLLNEQFAHIDVGSITKSTGFIIPLKQLNRTFFNGKDYFHDQLSRNQIVTNELFKARYVDWDISYIDDLLEISKMFSNKTTHICSLSSNFSNKTILRNPTKEIMGELSLIQPRFTKISISHKLLLGEFELVRDLLSFRKVRFSLLKLVVSFNLLSECLTVLSMCAVWPELNYILLSYSESDLENEQKAVANAVANFNKNFGYIRTIKVSKV